MKKIHITLLVLGSFFCDGSNAQTNSFNKTVLYDCVFNLKFDRTKEYKRFDASLIINNSNSSFFMLPRKDEVNSDGKTLDLLIEVDTLFRVIKNIEEESIIFGDITFNGKEKFYQDTLHKMDWVLLRERKYIDSLECYKAVTFFRGRSYTAWYCPAIPVSNGPWKLGGLPGLIIEAYDSNKDLYFLLTRIVTNEIFTEKRFADDKKYPDYRVYVRYWKEFFEKISGAASARNNPDCVSCQTSSTVKAYMWEKIL